MFSIITMASSTTKPTAMVSAISEMLSRLKPTMYITPAVATNASGTVMLGMIVAHTLRRKTKIVITTRTMVIASVDSTSETESRMLVERSDTRATCTERGIDASSDGIIALISSTTLIVLAPGSRWISNRSIRLPLYQAPVRADSDELIAWPMSLIRTGAPLR